MQVIPNGLGTILGKGEAGHVVGRLIGRVTGVKRGHAILGAAVAFAVLFIVTVGAPAAAAANPYPNTSSITIKPSTSVQNLSALLAGPNHESPALFAGVGLPFSVPAPPKLSTTPTDAGTTPYSIDSGVAQVITFTSTAPTSASVGGPTYTAAATASSSLPVTLMIDSGSTSVCSIDSNGIVSFNSIGTCTIDADQAGDSTYAPAPEAQQSFMVGQGSQTITITSTATNPVVGSTYTPTAIGGASGNPVVFSIDSSSTTGACSIDTSGVVAFTSVGDCVIDADQAGNSNYLAAPQAQQTVTVGQGSQTITITSTATNPVVGSAYTPAATGGASGNPVVFSIDSSSAGICSIDNTGVVTFDSVGTCTIDANQAADANYAAAPQAQQQIAVLNAQTITFSSTAPTSASVGGPTYTAAATASSSLPVTLTIYSGSTSVCSIDSNGVVSFTGVGSCVIDANQAGDSTYGAAPQVQQTIAVGKGSQTITFTSTAPTNATVNGPTYPASATGGSSTSPVVLTIDSSSAGICSIDSNGVVSFTGAGTCTIDANQAGDANYAAAAEQPQSFTVGKGSQTVSFTSPLANALVGDTYTPAAIALPSGLPTVVTIDASSTAGACSISGGVVSFTGAGNCVIDADQKGDTNYTAAQAQETVAVSLNSQRIDLTSSTPAQPVVGGSYTPTATATSGLPVVFSIDASSTPGACSISSGVVSFMGSGTCLIDANQAGNGAYAAAPQVQQPITIAALNSNTALVVGSTGLTATVSGNGPTPTGSVTFSVNGNAVGTVQLSQGVATLSYSFAPGQAYGVTVQYSGDKAYTESSATSTYTAPSNPVTTPPPSGTNTPPPSGTNTTPTSPPPAAKPKQAPLKIAVKLTSSRPERHGWWTAPVTVSFTCTRAGKRVRKCRRPVRLDRSGADQVVAGHKINIDLGKPSLRIVGLNAGATYLASIPAPGCQGRDGISGIRSCRISEKVIGRAPGAETVRFTAKAVNGAGTASSSSVTVSEQQLGLVGLVSSATGIYAVNTGRTYTLQVASKTKPLYVDGAVAPQLPVGGAHDWFVLNGHSDGTPLWELSVLLPSGLPQNAYWNVGVRIGDTIRIIAIRA